MNTNTEAEARHKLAMTDAVALAISRPDLLIYMPVVVLEASAGAFMKSWADQAPKFVEEAHEVARMSPRKCTGSTFYTALSGRLHRVTVEDLQPELRP